MLLPLETGTTQGQPRDTGIVGKPVIGVGVRHRRAVRRAGEARQLAEPGAARSDKAPFISYMKGALLYSARPAGASLDRHAGKP